MPLLQIKTNTDIEPGHRGPLLQEASKLIAEALGKPERYVMLTLETQQPMLFAGTDEPAAYLELKSIGLPTDTTKALSGTLCDFINKRLNIPKDRIYIEFADAKRNMFGWNGGTFER